LFTKYKDKRLITRGYLLILVDDRILSHKWSNEIDIFTSG